MASDYLPLTGGFTIQQFCDGAAKSRRNAKESYVIKVELFKDTRVEDWWRHELLIFTVVNPGGEGRSLLVFDRGRPDPEDQVDPQTFTQFVLAGFRGDSEDRMQFVEIDGDDIRMKVEHSVRVVHVEIKPDTFILSALAAIIKNGPYYGGYSEYHLFSANCWSWARGLVLDVTFLQYRAVVEARLYDGGDAGPPMTAEELQVCMLTQYGAWGGLLLKITSSEIKATSRNPTATQTRRDWPDAADHLVKRLRFFLVRILLFLYTVTNFFSRCREFLLGPSNWVTSFRRLTIHHDRTLDDKGRDITHLPEGPNFRDLLPSRVALDPMFIQGLYTPGRYPLTFITLTLGPRVIISSIHVYVSTGFSHISPTTTTEGTSQSSVHPFVRRSRGVRCSIMRKSADRSFVEVGGQRQIELRAASGAIAKSSTQYYTGICRIDGNDDFARQVQSGDTIVVWAEGYPDQVQYPRYASLKVVTQKPSFGFMDLGFMAGLSFKSGVLYQYLRLPPIVVILVVTLFYIIDAYIEDWIWSSLTMVINIVFTSSTPLPLPSDTEPILSFALPDFIEHCKVSDRDILQSPLKGLRFTQEKNKDISLLVDFEHAGIRYLAELFAPAPKYNMWHYASFVTTFHRLERDGVKIWRSEGEERARANEISREGFVVKVHFKPEGGTTLLGVIDLLRTAKRRYWFHFWNNAKEWSWPWWLMRTLVRSANDEIEFVRLDGKPEVYSAGDASGVLFQTREEWRAADVHPYGQNMLKDAVFVVTRTRAIYLIVLFFVSQQVLSPVVDDILDGMKSALIRRIVRGG